MVKKHVMVPPAKDVDLSAVKYEPEDMKAPHLTGASLKLFVKMVEMPLLGSSLVQSVKSRNKINEVLRNTVYPEQPMFKPEFPPQDQEPSVVVLDEDGKPEERVQVATKCLPPYSAPITWSRKTNVPFQYWKIRDYAHAYRSKLASPITVAEHIISTMEDLRREKPTMPMLISFDAEDIRKQAAASARRFEEGTPVSILDGIFMAIKDDIDCCPHPSKGATTWFHEVRPVEKDAVSVARLRQCGVILIGKANMHEMGMGTTGNNSNYGTARNPHAEDTYTGGSSSGPAALVGSGICSAALGTDGGGSIRIPSSLCGLVGLKTTYGRTDITGALCDSGTVEIIGPIASSVEDVMLVYAAILGASPSDKLVLKPNPPCLPSLSSSDGSRVLGSLRLGKYTEWFNDVHSTDISDKCEDILNLCCKTHGCEVKEIVIPELKEMHHAHLVSIGAEAMSSLNPYCEDGKLGKLTYNTRANLALFRSFSASDYVAAQCIRRRIMHHHMEIFKKVDVIVIPTTGMTAPEIPSGALKNGETNMQVTAYLMRFMVAGNLIGLPALSVPVGYDKQGLPIGLQIIGRPWGEATILRLAAAIEELCATTRKKPASFYDMLQVA